MPRKPAPIQFPTGGLVESPPYAAQPPGTTPSALNVRAYDALERRNRGGQRSGVSKLFTDTVSGSSPVQLVDTLVEAVAIIQNAEVGSRQADPASTVTNIETIRWAADASHVGFFDQSTTGDGLGIYPVTAAGLGTILTIPSVPGDITAGDFDPTGGYVAFMSDQSGGFLYIHTFSGGVIGSSAVATADITAFSLTSGMRCLWHPTGSHVLCHNGSSQFMIFPWDKGTETLGAAITNPASLLANIESFEWSPTGGHLAVYGANSPYLTAYSFDASLGTFGTRIDAGGASTRNHTDFAWAPDETFIVVATSAGGSGTDENSVIVYAWTGSAFSTKSVVFSGSPLVSGDRRLTIDNTGTYVVTTSAGDANMVGLQVNAGGLVAELNTIAIASASTMNVDFNPVSNLQFAWSSSTSTTSATYTFTPQTINASAREETIVAVAAGDVYRSDGSLSALNLTTNGDNAMSASEAVRGDSAFQNFFMVDGLFANYNYLDLSDNTVKAWTPTAGTLPRGSTDTTLGCRIIAVYRGRVVLAGLREDPQNWFMSVAGDPFDWDYSPTTPSATQAVAGNNTEAGRLGDIVTALAPYQDDVLIMGGTNSIWVMNGDAAAGGQIDNVTRGVGIVGPEAWAFDTGNRFYFFGVNGLYRMQVGSTEVELVSKNKLDRTFTDVDTNSVFVRLLYDPRWQGVHIMFVPLEEPSASPTYYWYDERNDSFFPDQYPTSFGPTAAVFLQGDNAENNAAVWGGFDGFIRRFDDSAKSDDGAAITSRVQIHAVNDGASLGDSKLSEAHINLDVQSEDVTLNVYAGQTREEAVLAGTPAFTRNLMGGRSNAVRQRARGSSIILELEQTAADSSWAYESGVVRPGQSLE